MQRLAAVQQPVVDSRAQRVLLKGLDQNIFESFIANAERYPYKDYTTLEKELEALAAKPRTLAQLRALKPGNPQQAQSVFSTKGEGVHPKNNTDV